MSYISSCVNSQRYLHQNSTIFVLILKQIRLFVHTSRHFVVNNIQTFSEINLLA